jgi:hypothetical protein
VPLALTAPAATLAAARVRATTRAPSRLRSGFITATPLRGRDIAQHLLDVLAATGVGRLTALGTLDSTAHRNLPHEWSGPLFGRNAGTRFI